jgi:hypothetical protein
MLAARKSTTSIDNPNRWASRASAGQLCDGILPLALQLKIVSGERPIRRVISLVGRLSDLGQQSRGVGVFHGGMHILVTRSFCKQ